MKHAKIVITTKTWPRDTYELFDYECLSTTSFSHHLSSSCSISRSGNSIQIQDLPQSSKESSESTVLAQISKTRTHFSIKKSGPDLWLVVKFLDQGYELEENDIIRLGRVKLRVKFLKTLSNLYTSSEVIKRPEDTCRICLSDETSEDNPLISPCECTGSMNFIHLSCLKTWFNSRMHKVVNQNSVCYYWKNIDCEVCKKPLREYTEFFDNALVNCGDLGVGRYLMLESVDKDKANLRGLYLIRFTDEETLKLGRGHEASIKLYDISVSRFHASIEYSRGKFVLRDNSSKFGTLVSIPERLEIVENVVVQIGRTMVSMDLDYSGESSTSED